MKRVRNARRWDATGQPVKATRLNGDASKHQQVPVAHQLTRRVQVPLPKPGGNQGIGGALRALLKPAAPRPRPAVPRRMQPRWEGQ